MFADFGFLSVSIVLETINKLYIFAFNVNVKRTTAHPRILPSYPLFGLQMKTKSIFQLFCFCTICFSQGIVLSHSLGSVDKISENFSLLFSFYVYAYVFWFNYSFIEIAFSVHLSIT
jgi:hypothetical protein